jgi:hypothetical protein
VPESTDFEGRVFNRLDYDRPPLQDYRKLHTPINTGSILSDTIDVNDITPQLSNAFIHYFKIPAKHLKNKIGQHYTRYRDQTNQNLMENVIHRKPDYTMVQSQYVVGGKENYQHGLTYNNGLLNDGDPEQYDLIFNDRELTNDGIVIDGSGLTNGDSVIDGSGLTNDGIVIDDNVFTNYDNVLPNYDITIDDNVPTNDVIAIAGSWPTKDVIASDDSVSIKDAIASDDSGSTKDVIASDDSGATKDVIASDDSGSTKDVIASDDSGSTKDVIANDDSGSTKDVIASDDSGSTKDGTSIDDIGLTHNEILSNENQLTGTEGTKADNGVPTYINMNNTDELNDTFNLPLMFGGRLTTVKNRLFSRQPRSRSSITNTNRRIYDNVGSIKRLLDVLNWAPVQRRSILDPLASHLIG